MICDQLFANNEEKFDLVIFLYFYFHNF